MKYIFLPKICIVLLFVLMIPVCAISQIKATYLGLDLSLESGGGDGLHPRIGVAFEKQFTKHGGLETGLYFRSYTYPQTITITDGTNTYLYSFSISTRYISIPFLYKFYTNIVNFAVGPTVDFYVGWEQKSGVENTKVNDVSVSPSVSCGLLAKISRSFNLSPRVLLEPELIFNPLSSSGYTYAGFGISIKYKL